MRLDKIYTRVGDQGKTVLATGAKVPKYSERIESYGSVDELNAFVGSLKDLCAQSTSLFSSSKQFEIVLKSLEEIQNDLFDIGGELSMPDTGEFKLQQVVDSTSIKILEEKIDALNAGLPALANFVLPGGHMLNSNAHICRTVCRRVERLIWKLYDNDTVRLEVPQYFNRLSDYFFVLSRWFLNQLSIEESVWKQRGKTQAGQ